MVKENTHSEEIAEIETISEQTMSIAPFDDEGNLIEIYDPLTGALVESLDSLGGELAYLFMEPYKAEDLEGQYLVFWKAYKEGLPSDYDPDKTYSLWIVSGIYTPDMKRLLVVGGVLERILHDIAPYCPRVARIARNKSPKGIYCTLVT